MIGESRTDMNRLPVHGHPDLALVPMKPNEGSELFDFYRANPSIDNHMPGLREMSLPEVIDKRQHRADLGQAGTLMDYWLRRDDGSGDDTANVGTFALYGIKPPEACLTAIVADEMQGHGLAQDVISTLGAHCRDNLGVKQLKFEIEDKNAGSVHTAASLGAVATNRGSKYVSGERECIVRIWELDIHDI